MTAIPRGRTRKAALARAVCALVVAGAGVTGCGGEDPDAGTNGVGKLPPAKIQSRTQSAAAAAGTVRLSGAVVSDKRTYKLDMQLKKDGGTGSVTSDGVTFRLLRVDEHLFIKADADFWNHQDGKSDDSTSDTAAAGKLEGMYVKVPKGDPAYQQLSVFTEKDVLLDGLLSLPGELATDGHHELNGVRTIRLTSDEGSGGRIDVSLEGKPYPLLLVRAGGAGTIRLTDWGRDFTLKAPAAADTVDYGQQLPSS
ncbi:hypothetical protein ACFU9Y_44480 [Streptomyces sp. NPDC057621]|uniref:Lipoprotein n=1 Tax=Streptomyces liliiviolaceus TaxID=2823109 RepID=A0A940XM13_9ACTN|nr:hypothetical protein [Streptomyces liliiviolaceus]MBQ0846662.1 hypothetical protein [Streptomyces liliiviolaceus]